MDGGRAAWMERGMKPRPTWRFLVLLVREPQAHVKHEFVVSHRVRCHLAGPTRVFKQVTRVAASVGDTRH